MQQHEISEILNRPLSQELLARDLTRLAYVAKDGTPRTDPPAAGTPSHGRSPPRRPTTPSSCSSAVAIPSSPPPPRWR